MKSKRAEKYIREVYNMDGHGYNGGSYRAAEINNNHPKYAIQAVEWAEEDMKKKAIISACNFCIQSGGICGHIDRDYDYCFQCDELRKFREELDKDN